MKERAKDTSTRTKRSNENNKKEKKPFDKKKYRLQKYSNKYKINQWEERKKKAILRTYYKDIDKSEAQALRNRLSVKNEAQNENGNTTQPKKISAFHKAKREFLRKKDEKRLKKEELLRVKAEREEALSKYKEQKIQKFKKLTKKTRKGQPVMKDRIEMLLEKIQNQVSN